MKTAIALFVKNEVHDIAAWIGWHFAQGVDKLFIYDDHSTDGTYEVLLAARSLFNIAVGKTDPKTTPHFYRRQGDAYMDACLKAAGQFDWIGFLDGDEYLSLQHDTTIGDFLARFDTADGIGLNWRIYGSSHRALKTKIPPYEAFTFHASKDLDDQHLIKSFIRPEKCTLNYINPHRYSLEGDNYVDASGNRFEWTAEGCKTISWENACINHYYCRTMEHYIDRIRKRAGFDLHDSTGYWEHFNRNDISQKERPETVAKANAIVQQIRERCVRDYIASISGTNPASGTPHSAARVFSLRCHTGSGPALDQNMTYLSQRPEDDVSVKVSGIVYNDDPDHIWLAVEDGPVIRNIPFHIQEDGRFACAYRFVLEKRDNSDGFLLRSPINDKYLCFIALEHGAAIECNREDGADWETITLTEKSDSTLTLSDSPAHIDSPPHVLNFIREHGSTVSYSDVLLALDSLPPHARKDFLDAEENKIISWL
ncbi:glycosyltransferase family 2 protein [Acetobacter fallax]|uniref:Glycosyl transferase family 2 n=1 Tax=Acetobacter fallax TaxID=1737473 RepID=A0ABX0K6K2_9PROT|nr:glycosyltransferase family 2 protein [Acetobacter fallax]NHO31377.1 hypothetical protein [Acetobacter fallax]NHO35041.1 hypothetical protein [Acetobacter fallax]